MSEPMSATDAIRTPMANQAESEASATAPPPAPMKGKRKNAVEIPKKVQKRLDSLLAKVENLTKENKRLKAYNKLARAATTRIHRIPK